MIPEIEADPKSKSSVPTALAAINAHHWRLSKKGVIPYWMRSFFEREAISPSVDMGRRYRIVVRYDGIDNISTIPRPFWTASYKIVLPQADC
jgi:hypothetical protein